ncbi:GntR family transcriptional regulator [Lacticaseibacillus nasuensis]|uniref:GntR family transcriptional regulator n=1 Tax=Lacticaseibacillus nasuensis JCM 17158 TaxID=1291734 RepID=A0A0R1JQ41_9LACO|nr:GntR family transcriptional regulator [Lacticaseibacillus nasuensis]KRK70500.1 GntR family transcriptional regulator [Lacticaseibacillus nasuensis JCM 17158]
MEKKYQTVTDTIQRWITSGQYHENDKLPTESELMAQFDVSRHTVRKALGDLESDGYVYRVQGGGTYVAERRLKPVSTMQSVAVMATHINDYIFPAIISGIERVLSAQSVSLMLSSTENSEELEAKNLSKLMNSAIDGLIVEPTRSAFTVKNEAMYAQLAQSHVPIVTMNARFKDLQVPYFVMDDFEGGKMATEYVLQHHHTHIMGIFKTDDQQGVDRMNGYVYALQKANQPTVATTFLYQSGKSENNMGDRLRKLFAQTDRPTAMICYNDKIAVLAYNIAQTMGIQVPEQLSIIGFDNSSLASSYGLHLTSVNHPKANMGRDAAELILRMIQNPTKDFLSDSKTYTPELVIGESVVDLKQ